MADNLYDQLNRYSLSDVGRGLSGLLKGFRPKLTAEQLRALTAPGVGRGAQAAPARRAGNLVWTGSGVMPADKFNALLATDAQLRKEGYGVGVREYDPLERGVRPAGYIQYGTRDGVTPDRRQSDTYKQYAMTAPGQFERYFKTPEFDYAFGAQSGKGPKSPEEMAALAAQSKAPTTESLSDYYRSQSAMGRVNQAEIQKMYADRPDLQKWAAANPMLAQREFVKRQGGRPAAADQETVMGDLGTRAQAETGYTPQAFGLPANPVPPTQQPGPGGMDQGTRVSFFRGADEIAPQQAMKTTGEGMPQFQTTLSKAEDFLRKF